MTTLLLVRHGATAWTAERRLQGRTDIGLSPSGRADTAALAPLVAAWSPRSLVVSPLSRTLATAALLSKLEPRLDARWLEAGLGEWEGLGPEQIGEDYARWRAGGLTPPGGEAARDVAARVEAAALDAAKLPGPVVVVTHGGAIRAVLARFIGLATHRLEPVAAPSLTVVEIERRGAGRLRHYNLPPGCGG